MNSQAGQQPRLSPQAYSDAFVKGRPREAALVLQTRLRKAKIVSDEVADYFAARREIEEAYLKALGKISRKTFFSDPDALGPSLAPLVERLVTELSEIGNIHSELDARIAEECEGPLRDASAGEWGKIRQHDDSIAPTLREINSLETQLQKEQKRAEGTVGSKKASAAHAKVSETERALAQAYEVWEMEAPFAFDAYQRMDQSRLDLICESVARFETVQSDAANRLTAATEKTIALALAFKSEDDMSEFIATSSEAVQYDEASAGYKLRNRQPNQPPTANPPAATQPDRSLGEFGASTPSLSSDLRAQSNGGPAGSSAKAPFAGGSGAGSTLKNALSRFGRGKSSRENKDATTSQHASLPEEAPPWSGSTGQRVPSSSSTADLNDVPTPATAANVPARGNQPASALSGSAALAQVDEDGFTIPPSNRQRAPWDSPQTGADQVPRSEAVGGQTGNMTIGAAPMTVNDTASDAEAFERVRSALLTSGPSAPQRRNTTRRDRRDVRATTYNPTLPSDLDFSSNSSTGIAGARPVSQFGLLSMGSGIQSNLRSPSSPASAVGNGTFDSIPEAGKQRSQSVTSHLSTSNPFGSSSSGQAANGLGASSVESAALQSSPSGQSGALRASIVETVSAVFTGAELTRLLVVGEVSLSLRDVVALMPVLGSQPAASQRVRIHIDAFEELEKAAPNPSFLAPVADTPGEYTMDVQALLQAATASGNGQVPPAAVLLKYQLHISDSSRARRVPLTVHAQWRCEEHQTSLLIAYGANPESPLANASSDLATASTLTDLSLRVSVEPTPVKGVMSKPSGIWSADQARMLWTLPDPLALSTSVSAPEGAISGPQKVLARFQVDGAGTPQPVQVRWRVAGRTLSSLGIRIVPNGSDAGISSAIHIAQTTRMVVAGKFIANP